MLTDYKNILVATMEQIEAYETKPTKAGSKRIRALSLLFGKQGVQLRHFMLKLDKAK